MFDSKTIDKTDLDLASSQLWNILKLHIDYLSTEDKKIIELAFITMVDAHDQQRRKSGEFYIIHPVSACIILANQGMEKDTLAACLMHDVPEDTQTTLKDLSQIFAYPIVFLVEGVTKLSKIKYKGNNEYVDNLQKMLAAMCKDQRVILIKLADRLHNLSTLQYVSPQKQKRIAQESLEIYAPIAEKLGIAYFRGEIEDAAFPYIYPEEYLRYINESDVVIEKRKQQLQVIQIKTSEILKDNNILGTQMQSRAKRYYSIYQKATAKHKEIEDIYDLMALRIIALTVEDCYNILSVLHANYKPIPKRLKDYIKSPKKNGYQSIHTTVEDENSGLIFEFQIRTEEMDNFAELGVASHWSYKTSAHTLPKDNQEWINELVTLQKDQWSDEDYLSHMRMDLFRNRIFVMTPKGDPIDLPEGGTVLDFAFKIHDEIGSKAVMAMVNSKSVGLDYVLNNADIVEIITSKNQTPTRDWIKMVKTVNAARHIRQILRKKGEKFPNTHKRIKETKPKVTIKK